MQSMMNLRRATTASSPLRTLGVRYMSGKDVRFGDEARAKMLAGVDKLADAVQVRRGDALLFIFERILEPDASTTPTSRFSRDARARAPFNTHL